MAENEDRRRDTSAQLRDDIDSGRTGEKVDFPDPAAAPLGTDDEAAGVSPSAGAVAGARQREGQAAAEASRGLSGGVLFAIVACLAVTVALLLWAL